LKGDVSLNIKSNPLFVLKDNALSKGNQSDAKNINQGIENTEKRTSKDKSSDLTQNFFYSYFIPDASLGEDSSSDERYPSYMNQLLNKAREQLIELYSNIPEGYFYTALQKKNFKQHVASCDNLKQIVYACLDLEQSLKKTVFKTNWSKRIKRTWYKYADEIETTAQFGILVLWLERNIRAVLTTPRKKKK